MSPTVNVPCPTAFLDPLTEIDSCFYYAVPKFFDQNHPNTRWLITMIKNNEEDRLKHKMETSPAAFKGAYYQMIDCPQIHIPEDVVASPMFRRQAVVYLSALGVAIYLGSAAVAELLLSHKDMYDDPMCDPNEAQFATHLQDNDFGDFHSFPPFVVMMRRSSFRCSQSLMKAGWDPSKPVAMPMRRRFERRAFYFRDWLEVALSVLACRPMYHLQSLLCEMTSGPVYAPVLMPMEKLLPPNPKAAEPSGLIDVEELPAGVQMIGVRSVLDMAEHYDRYLQMRQCARQVADLKREAVAVGLNPEVLMIQAQDFDGGVVAPPEQTEGSNAVRGANNSSAAGDPAAVQARHVVLNVNINAAKKGKSTEPRYATEGCRILHYALMRDPRGKSLQVCMEAFCLLIRRGFFLLSEKPELGSAKARDVRNVIVLMLNLVQREQCKVDKIVQKIKSGVKKFAHLEEHRQLENRKTACIQCISKMVGVLTKLLLQSKALVDFVQSEFPPYIGSLIDFELNPHLAQKFEEIKFGIIREFNACKESWVYLDSDMLQTARGITEMQLRFKVGKKPKLQPKGASKGANKNKNNMGNTNSCLVSYTRVHRRPKRTNTASNVAASLAHLTPDEASGVGNLTYNTGNLPDLHDTFDCNNSPNPAADACPRDIREVSAAAEGDGGSAKAPADMELLLASMCREMDSLFKPLEKCGSSSGGPRDTKSSALVECSTIEPELAPTPMPTPEHSSEPADAAVAATTGEPAFVERDRRRPLQPGLRKKLKQSGVARLFSRFSTRDATLRKSSAG